jgi:hypothetical protein
MIAQATFVPYAEPPTTKRELVKRLRALLRSDWAELPAIKRYNGNGGPGRYLEDLLGLTAGNQDVADCAAGWEVKWYTRRTQLMSLFHKQCDDCGIMRQMVDHYGKLDKLGRLSLRHTIKGTSPKFKVYSDAGNILVYPLHEEGPVAVWSHDTLLNVAGGKLRRLAVVRGVKRGRQVRFESADLYENMHLTELADCLTDGRIAIDFDVREKDAGNHVLRDHGTKFRVRPSALRDLYDKHEQL